MRNLYIKSIGKVFFKPEIVVGSLFFVVLLPIVLKISYLQNDDFYYFHMVSEFLRGNFILDPIIAPTFYVQGFLGMYFVSIFGLAKLPILTLLVSLVNFYIFVRIMKDLFYLDSKRALLIGIFFFLLPINLYTYLGFMTEQYFMAFFLLSIYFMHKYMNTNKKRYFAFMYLFIFFSILVRQIGLLFPFVLFLTYIYWKKYRYAGVHFVFFVALLAFYQVLFPRTEEMVDWSYSFEKILNPSYVYSFVYVSMLFVVSMLLPFFVTFINFDDFKFERKRVINFVALAVLFGFLLNHFYAPSYFSWEEFPYIGNVFGQNGFLPFMLQGERQLGGLLPKMFVYWEYAAKAVLAMFVSYIFVYRKLVVTFYSIYVLVYLAALLGGRDFYDRYLLFLMPVGVLFILSVYCNLSRWRALALIVFISMFFVLNYQFTMNFVLSNDKVWEVSNSLVSEGSASPSKIKTSKAWMNIHYDEEVSEFDYLVTYDPPSKFNDFEVYYKQLGEYDLNFLFSMYENNKLYLYEIL